MSDQAAGLSAELRSRPPASELPPSTGMTAPVTKLDQGELSISAISATSSRAAEAAERNGGGHGRERLGAGCEPAHAFGVADGPRHDRIDAHAVHAPFHGQHAREHVDTRLGGAHMRLVGRGVGSLRRRDVDDRCTRPPQEFMRPAQHVEGAHQVDVDHGSKALARHAQRRRHEVAGGTSTPAHRWGRRPRAPRPAQRRCCPRRARRRSSPRRGRHGCAGARRRRPRVQASGLQCPRGRRAGRRPRQSTG